MLGNHHAQSYENLSVGRTLCKFPIWRDQLFAGHVGEGLYLHSLGLQVTPELLC